MLHKSLFTTAKTKEAKTPMLKYLTIQINALNTESERLTTQQQTTEHCSAPPLTGKR